MTLLRGGTGIETGTGKSGMEPTDDTVDGRDADDIV